MIFDFQTGAWTLGGSDHGGARHRHDRYFAVSDSVGECFRQAKDDGYLLVWQTDSDGVPQEPPIGIAGHAIISIEGPIPANKPKELTQ